MIATWQRILREHPRGVDLALGLLLVANAVPGTMVGTPGFANPVAWWPGLLLTAVASVALAARRSRPRATVVAATACAMAVAGTGYLLTVLVLGPLMFALYSLSVRTDTRTTYLYALLSTGLVVATALVTGPASEPTDFKTIGPAAWLLLPAAFGSMTRLGRAYMEALQGRAELAERTREEEARHRVAEERLRIARELHDDVAHHLALANAQANAVAHLLSRQPEQAQKIADQLTGTTSAALRELKAAVGLMRQHDDPEAPLEPAPGLDQLPALADSFESVGLVVTVVVEGEREDLAPGVDLTAYRIVQEALTNVSKHAGVKTARVRLGYTRKLLSITVTDDGTASTAAATAADSTGYGLIGMGERARSVGGRVRTGPRPNGGFEVATELPLHPWEEERTP